MVDISSNSNCQMPLENSKEFNEEAKYGTWVITLGCVNVYKDLRELNNMCDYLR